MPVLQRVSVSVKNILLASDFSSASDKAAAYAKALALNFRSSVEIALVEPVSPGEVLLVHAGTALGRASEQDADPTPTHTAGQDANKALILGARQDVDPPTTYAPDLEVHA